MHFILFNQNDYYTSILILEHTKTILYALYYYMYYYRIYKIYILHFNKSNLHILIAMHKYSWYYGCSRFQCDNNSKPFAHKTNANVHQSRYVLYIYRFICMVTNLIMKHKSIIKYICICNNWCETIWWKIPKSLNYMQNPNSVIAATESNPFRSTY